MQILKFEDKSSTVREFEAKGYHTVIMVTLNSSSDNNNEMKIPETVGF